MFIDQAEGDGAAVPRLLNVARQRRFDALPPTLPPRGLSREAAAGYVGVSPGKFDQLVRDGRMPKPKTIDARKVWDRRAIDISFEALPGDGAQHPWDAAW